CTYVYAYAYLYNFVPKACAFGPYSHFWSLAVEEHFYLLWPFVVLLGMRVAVLALTLFVAASLLFAGLFNHYEHTHYINRWTFPAAAPIAFGCLAAYFSESEFGKRFLERRNLSFAMWLGFIFILASALDMGRYY